MTTEGEKQHIFHAQKIDSAEIEGLVLHIFDNDLLWIQAPKYLSIDVPLFRKAQDYLISVNPHKKYHFVFEFDSFAEVDPEMRKLRAKPDGTQFSLSDAIVISNLPQKMLGDFYLRINKPSRPTRFFFSLEKAVEWSLKVKSGLKP
jgi:hypothetical protein